MLDSCGDFLLTCKPDSHKTLYEFIDGDDALRVNWLAVTVARPDGAVTYRNAFIANLHVNRDNVAELAACGRTRWKIENGTFNVLKRQGYHLEHNFGHGKDTLARPPASLTKAPPPIRAVGSPALHLNQSRPLDQNREWTPENTQNENCCIDEDELDRSDPTPNTYMKALSANPV